MKSRREKTAELIHDANKAKVELMRICSEMYKHGFVAENPRENDHDY